MMLTLSSWFGLRTGLPETPRPMLIRVGEPTDPERTVELFTRWHVGKKEVTTTRRLYVSDGMCLLAWTRDARAVSIEVRLPTGIQHLTVEREGYYGQVLDVRPG